MVRLRKNNKALAKYKNAYLTVRFDGTYATAIHERFNWADKDGSVPTSCGAKLGAWDDGDGWIYVTARASECTGCGETTFDFVKANSLARDCTEHAGHGNSWGSFVGIAFDKKTGKVVTANPCVLERYPVGTFFMEVD